MADEQEFVIKKQPVYAREESGAKLFGWTLEEFATVGSVGLFALFLVPFAYLKLAVFLLGFIWVKKLKQHFPEKFLSSMWRFHTRQDYFHSAGQHDIEWRPPIREDI